MPGPEKESFTKEMLGIIGRAKKSRAGAVVNGHD